MSIEGKGLTDIVLMKRHQDGDVAAYDVIFKRYYTELFNYANKNVRDTFIAASTLVKLSNGFADGSFSSAKIGSMEDMAIDKDGNLYILDAQNKAVRKVFFK